MARLVIIGAVAAGTSAAAKARRNNENLEIILYEKDGQISYSGCGLPYFIGGKVARLEELVPRNPEYFRTHYQVDVLIRHQVLHIEPDSRKLVVKDLAGGRIFADRYDDLILATGAIPVVPPIPGSGGSHVFTLRNPADAEAIRRTIEEKGPRTAVIVGSGFLGLEMAESLRTAGLAVTLVEKMPHLCPWLDEDMAPYLEQELKKNEIRVLAGRTVARILNDTVILDDETIVPAELVLLAVGIRPNTDLAKNCGIRLGPTGAIAVDNRMRTNLPHIYACGDCAESFSIIDGRPLYHPLGSTANKTGRIAGDAVTGGSLVFRGIAGTGIFKAFDLAVAASGLRESAARAAGYDIVVSHSIKPDKPSYYGGTDLIIKAIADRRADRLLGVQVIGKSGVDKRVDVFVTAISAGMPASALADLDLAYAPPFATTRDPVLYTGMILDNALHHGRELLTADTLLAAEPGQYQVVDARVARQYGEGHVDEAASIPHADLRQRLDELDLSQPVVTYCNKGVTGNAAQNILLNRGFKKVYNLSGGYTHYKMRREMEEKKEPSSPDSSLAPE